MEGTLGCSDVGAAMLLRAGGGESTGLTLDGSGVVDELSREGVDKCAGGARMRGVSNIDPLFIFNCWEHSIIIIHCCCWN